MSTRSALRALGHHRRSACAFLFALANTVACHTFVTYEQRLDERLIGRSPKVLRSCGNAPEVEADGDIERYRYELRIVESRLRAGTPDPFGDSDPGRSDRRDDPVETIAMDCSMEVTVIGGKIREVDVTGLSLRVRDSGSGVIDPRAGEPRRRTDRECLARFLQCVPEPDAGEPR